MAFYVGQKIVCVNDDFADGDLEGGRPNRPSKGCVYTVRDCVIVDFEDDHNVSCVRLEEIINPIVDWEVWGNIEVSFWAGRFEPVVERKTNIEVFTKMLLTDKVSA